MRGKNKKKFKGLTYLSRLVHISCKRAFNMLHKN
jgi:hypothetical protein